MKKTNIFRYFMMILFLFHLSLLCGCKIMTKNMECDLNKIMEYLQCEDVKRICIYDQMSLEKVSYELTQEEITQFFIVFENMYIKDGIGPYDVTGLSKSSSRKYDVYLYYDNDTTIMKFDETHHQFLWFLAVGQTLEKGENIGLRYEITDNNGMFEFLEELCQ